MVFAFAIADAPERVVPCISFDEFGVTCGKQLFFQVCIACELVCDTLVHDVKFDSFPIWPQIDTASGFLGFIAIQCGKGFSVFWLNAFCSLEGTFYTEKKSVLRKQQELRTCWIRSNFRYGIL